MRGISGRRRTLRISNQLRTPTAATKRPRITTHFGGERSRNRDSSGQKTEGDRVAGSTDTERNTVDSVQKVSVLRNAGIGGGPQETGADNQTNCGSESTEESNLKAGSVTINYAQNKISNGKPVASCISIGDQ